MRSLTTHVCLLTVGVAHAVDAAPVPVGVGGDVACSSRAVLKQLHAHQALQQVNQLKKCVKLNIILCELVSRVDLTDIV